MLQSLLAWLTGLPSLVLYVMLALIAAIENVFPPLPSDTVVAFGTWLAARGHGSAIVAFLSTWLGNVAGAAGMYAVGRRHGTVWMRRKFPRLADQKGEARLRSLYSRYGLAALVVSRFIPGIRALVPPVAGALQIPPARALGAMAVASAVWYGSISYVAFNADAEWSELMRLIHRSGTLVAASAAVLLATGIIMWVMRRRRDRAA